MIEMTYVGAHLKPPENKEGAAHGLMMPDFGGIGAYGNTKEEALTMAREMALWHYTGDLLKGFRPPEPIFREDHIDPTTKVPPSVPGRDVLRLFQRDYGQNGELVHVTLTAEEIASAYKEELEHNLELSKK